MDDLYLPALAEDPVTWAREMRACGLQVSAPEGSAAERRFAEARGLL